MGARLERISVPVLAVLITFISTLVFAALVVTVIAITLVFWIPGLLLKHVGEWLIAAGSRVKDACEGLAEWAVERLTR